MVTVTVTVYHCYSQQRHQIQEGDHWLQLVQRCCTTMPSYLTQTCCEMAGLSVTDGDGVTKEIRKSRMTVDENDVQKV